MLATPIGTAGRAAYAAPLNPGRLIPLRSIMTHSFSAKPKTLARAQGANAVLEPIRSPPEPSPTARR